MILASNFSETLSELMDERNLTTEELGKAVGVDGSMVRYWKEGKNKLRLSNALKLSAYFECSLEFLMGRTDIRLNFLPKPCPPFYDSLMSIMKTENISRYRIVKDTAFSNGHFTKWKKGADPSVETLLDLAAYLGCTLDYLVGCEK